MATNTSSKRPATTLRCCNIKATIGQNVSEKGQFLSTTFSRPFRNQAGEWRNGTAFGRLPRPSGRFLHAQQVALRDHLPRILAPLIETPLHVYVCRTGFTAVSMCSS